MHRVYFAAVGMAVAVATTSPIAAQDTDDPSGPQIVYGVPPLAIDVPPTGYLLDPSDMRKPMYVVNQGPVYSGPGIYAVPTYSEGGYAYTEPFPYVRSFGYGPYSIFQADRPLPYRYYRQGYRPYGYPPYGAYRYRPAPSAKIIHVPPPSEWTSLR
jgi:hypothetical protein